MHKFILTLLKDPFKIHKKGCFQFFLDYPQQNHSRVLHSITALFPSARTEWVDKQELNSSCIDRINALFIGNAFSTFNYLASAPLIESNAASSNPYVFETEIFLDTNRPSVHT